jgi:hypothetical protein
MKTKKQTPSPSLPKPLYHHKTSGGAEYLTDKFILCPDGSKEGIFDGARVIIRIDGDITKDAELIACPVADADAPAVREALRKLIEAGKHLATPATHDGLTLADAQAAARQWLICIKAIPPATGTAPHSEPRTTRNTRKSGDGIERRT